MLQVDLALDVEGILPQFIRRRFVMKCETIEPNAHARSAFRRLFSFDSDTLSSDAINKALSPELVSQAYSTLTNFSSAIGQYSVMTVLGQIYLVR